MLNGFAAVSGLTRAVGYADGHKREGGERPAESREEPQRTRTDSVPAVARPADTRRQR